MANNKRIVEEAKHLLSTLAHRGAAPRDVVEEEAKRRTILHELDVTQYLIIKSSAEEGPEIRGGTPDALLVKAAEVTQNGEANRLSDGRREAS